MIFLDTFISRNIVFEHSLNNRFTVLFHTYFYVWFNFVCVGLT